MSPVSLQNLPVRIVLIVPDVDSDNLADSDSSGDQEVLLVRTTL